MTGLHKIYLKLGLTPKVATVKVTYFLNLEETLALHNTLSPFYVRRRAANGKL